MIARTYGKGPISHVLVHGGPGAAGSLECMAADYGRDTGVLEPWQTALSITGQIAELHEQILTHCENRVLLVGHSWGAWLSILYAARHPESLKGVVLLSSGMLAEGYGPLMLQKRLSLLSQEEKEEFLQIQQALLNPNESNRDALLARLGALSRDDYDPLPETTCCIPDGKMYNAIWPEASNMRAGGELLRAASSIVCPLFVVHGLQDSHPMEGVTEPLDKANIPYTVYALDRCGHSPWRERHAANRLRRILLEEIPAMLNH